MRFVAPPISEHRLQRFHRWVLMWLTWFAAFLEAANRFAPFSEQATCIAHRWLDRIERVLVKIVILRAAPRMRGVNKPKYLHRRLNQTQMGRAVVGVAMRKMLRSKDLRRRIVMLSQNIDGLVARLLKRLPRGLTRRRPIIACPEMRLIGRVAAYLGAPLEADTS